MTAQQIHTPGTFDEYRRRASFARKHGFKYEPHWNAFKTAAEAAERARNYKANAGNTRQWFIFVDPRGGVNMRGA